MRNLPIGFIDYKKAYDLVPHSWLKETLKIVGVADNIHRLLGQSMCNSKAVLTSNGYTLGQVSIQHGIFQGNSLFPFLFIIILISLSMTLNSTNYKCLLIIFYSWMTLSCMVKQRELQSLVHTVRIISKDVGIEFVMDKCV